MSDRVSIKGKGADIFFGEEGDLQHNDETKAGQPADVVAPAGSGAEASRHLGAAAPSPESAGPPADAPVEASHADAEEFFTHLLLPASLRRKLRAMSREQHPYHTSVRITKEEQDSLKALAFELTSKLQLPVTVNDVARIALRLLSEDYAIRKKESLLVQVLKEDDQF